MTCSKYPKQPNYEKDQIQMEVKTSGKTRCKMNMINEDKEKGTTGR